MEDPLEVKKKMRRVVRRCIVPACHYEKERSVEGQKVHLFRVPSHKEERELWQGAVRDDLTLTKNHYVCENHFDKSAILMRREFVDSSGAVIGDGPYKVVRLKKGAVPCKNLSKDPLGNVPLKESNDRTVDVNYLTPHAPDTTCDDTDRTQLIFDDITKSNLNLPVGWIRTNSECDGTRVVHFTRLLAKRVGDDFINYPERSVAVTEMLEVQIFIAGTRISHSDLSIDEALTSIDNFSTFLFAISRHNICIGCVPSCNATNFETSVSFKDNSNTWRHKQCKFLLPSTLRCEYCKRLKQTLYRKRVRSEQNLSKKRIRLDVPSNQKNELYKLRTMQYSSMKQKTRLLEGKNNLKKELVRCKKKLANIADEDLIAKFKKEGSSEGQQQTIRQILESSRRQGSNGVRYSYEWLLKCLLLHMRSPSGYKYLRDLDVVPLPCPSTIRRHLSKTDPAGFDKEFSELLHNHPSGKSPVEKHKTLPIDEMSTKEGVTTTSPSSGNISVEKDAQEKRLVERDLPSTKKNKRNIGAVKNLKRRVENAVRTESWDLPRSLDVLADHEYCSPAASGGYSGEVPLRQRH